MRTTGFVLLVSLSSLRAAPQELKARVAAGAHVRHQTPTVTTIAPSPAMLATAMKGGLRCMAWRGDEEIPAQAELFAGPDGKVVIRAHWMTPSLASGENDDVSIGLAPGMVPGDWRVEKGPDAGFTELSLGGRRIHRHVTAYDPKRPDQTYKPFLHVYDLSGKRLITKGSGGTYTHHRGVFLGWNKVSYGEGGKQKADFWHCKGVSIRHQEFLPANSEGPVFHEITALNHWIDGAGVAVLEERRRVRTYCCGASKTILDFAVTLQALGEHPVRLDGDGHHAGFQFRAPQDVHENRKDTVYVRPASAAKRKNDMWSNCPWTLCRFALGGQETAVMYMTAPANPTPAAMSTRPYGRFGSFFKTTLRPKKPLHLRYRILILDEPEGRPFDVATLQDLYDDFANPLAGEIQR